MSLSVVYSRASLGINAPLVTVETHISNGFPQFNIVGLPATAVKESKDRVRSALNNSQFKFPAKRITVNLAPADLPKTGGRFDLPIALGILIASEQLPDINYSDYEFAGELALNGDLRSINCVLPFAIETSLTGRKLLLPYLNADEASLPSTSKIIPASNLIQICHHFLGIEPIEYHRRSVIKNNFDFNLDIADICGQKSAKRALEIAASGKHSLLMVGPPGTGKTMLASRLPGILPPLDEDDALQTAAVNSVRGKKVDLSKMLIRPFRAPHHTSSSVAIVGGGRPPKPGEISLAHHGVLFLDEFPEFNRSVLEALREPLESGKVNISRAAHQVEFPADFQLIAAMNPCPCGYAGDAKGNCQCTSQQINKYQTKISGPLMDRIDLHISMSKLPRGSLSRKPKVPAESSTQVRSRVLAARLIQHQRCKKLNSQLQGTLINKYCELGESGYQLLDQAAEKLNLSARAYHRVMRVARTIADLENSKQISLEHLSEALMYRPRI